MALVVGSISINSATGATISATGAAGAAFAVLVAKADFGALAAANPPAYAKAKQQLADIAEAIATSTAYLLGNAQLQGTVAPGIPVSTTGTAAAQSGATTSTGSITGTVV